MGDNPLGVGISEMLAARGVRHIFGVPGVHNQELYRGLEGSGITHVLARHEAGAGFMADGYARATAGPGGGLRDHRSGADQYHDPAGPGLVGFGAGAGDLVVPGRDRRAPRAIAPDARSARRGGHGLRLEP